MDEESPLDPPEGNWWNREVNRRETLWLGISGAWALSLFGWMLGWTQAGDQNQIGPTYEVDAERYQQKVQAYKERAGRLTIDGEEFLVPPDTDVYIGAFQWAWDGLPAVLRPGETYKFHLGSYDVNHGFGVRPEGNLSKQISLQIVPGYEWVLEMSFDETGPYHVVCNSFCGVGHRSMHGRFLVADYDESDVRRPESGGEQADYGGWFTGDAPGGTTANYDGPVDRTGRESVTVAVGVEGNGGTFAYDPPAVLISPDTSVQFEWASDNHNVLIEEGPGDWSGHEPLEAEGYSFEHTFETEGIYNYYCDPHLSLGMKGVVEVK